MMCLSLQGMSYITMTISVGIFYEKKYDFSQEKSMAGHDRVYADAFGTDWTFGISDDCKVRILQCAGRKSA